MIDRLEKVLDCYDLVLETVSNNRLSTELSPTYCSQIIPFFEFQKSLFKELL